MNKHSHVAQKLKFVFVGIILLISFQLQAQEQKKTEKRKSQITPLPAISYTPETGATIGLIGDYYFDLADGDTTVSRSRIRLLGTFTTKKQSVIETGWELYLPNDNYRTFGTIVYRIFNDRNYGLGNNPSNIFETDYKEIEDGALTGNLRNYQPYDVKRLRFEGTFLKKIKPNFYVGPAIEYENIFDVKNDSSIVNGNLAQQLGKIQGARFGIGANLTYDNRDSRFYPTKGFFGQFNSAYYFYEGVNYSFNRLDIRYYLNVIKNHTLAARFFSQNIFGAKANEISLYGLARLGGRDLLRGYFFGTYQHENAISFQTEYRLPFTFLEDSFLPLLGRLGAVAFFSGGQVFGNNEPFVFSNFRLAAGGGIRFNINKKETTNVRIDYGFGLHSGASYDNKGQQALYFFLSEAF